MSDTPRTDILLAQQFDDRMPMIEAYPQMVDQCRQLEHELNEAVAALETLRACIHNTRGPDAHKAVEIADSIIAKHRSQK